MPRVERPYTPGYGVPADAAGAALAELIPGAATFLVTPERAFGIIERSAEFGSRATRWAWETS